MLLVKNKCRFLLDQSNLTNCTKNINPEELKREFIHPEHNTKTSIEENIGIYAWHCNHHLAHIEQAIKYANNCASKVVQRKGVALI